MQPTQRIRLEIRVEHYGESSLEIERLHLSNDELIAIWKLKGTNEDALLERRLHASPHLLFESTAVGEISLTVDKLYPVRHYVIHEPQQTLRQLHQRFIALNTDHNLPCDFAKRLLGQHSNRDVTSFFSQPRASTPLLNLDNLNNFAETSPYRSPSDSNVPEEEGISDLEVYGTFYQSQSP